MNKDLRNLLRNVVTQCRRLIETSVSEVLQGTYGIHSTGLVEEAAGLTHLSEEEKQYREQAIVHLRHIESSGLKSKDAVAQLVREVAFTHLNRLAAFKLMESRKLIREAVSRGPKSNGYKFYLADHPPELALDTGGQQEIAYRRFLLWQAQQFSGEISALFSQNDLANRLFPPQRVLDHLLELINGEDIKSVWAPGEDTDDAGDETIGWIYQYFTPKELREQARQESAAPRNSYELAFRNQFYTPRYVVQFLVDNTLGRIWYEMRKGDTSLTDKCKYFVRHQKVSFLEHNQSLPSPPSAESLSQEQIIATPVIIQFRPKADPRELKILDPAVGSAHFLLYCFDLLLIIYEEAYGDTDLGPALRKEYPTLGDFKNAVPGLILRHNLHGIDIDLRATQIAKLALWLRAQRAFQDLGIKSADRPVIFPASIVCAEPMPGEAHLLEEFTATLQPRVLGQLVKVVFDKMKLAGEAGSLLKIEEELTGAISEAKRQWLAGPKQEQLQLFQSDRQSRAEQGVLFDIRSVTEEAFWIDAEARVLDALRLYSASAANGHALTRYLFAEDAERGFGFIDLCRKRYDVVLMNPPFGEFTTGTLGRMRQIYSDSSSDILCAFVERGANLCNASGMLGTITNRTPFFTAGAESWREKLLLGKGDTTVRYLADLGHGVLDAALVEAAAYCLSKDCSQTWLWASNVTDTASKESALQAAVAGKGAIIVQRELLNTIPGKRLAYWLPVDAISCYSRLPSLATSVASVDKGMSTTDDDRFVRASWEVPEEQGTKTWMLYAKGGEYSPFVADIHLVVDWTDNGHEIADCIIRKYPYLNGNPAWVLHPETHHGEAGLTYTKRTTSSFSVRVLPKGCRISDLANLIYDTDRKYLIGIMAMLATSPFQYLLEANVPSIDSSAGGTAARHYEVGTLREAPLPKTVAREMAVPGLALWKAAKGRYELDEASGYFVPPLYVEAQNLQTAASLALEACERHWLDAIRLHQSLDADAMKAYGLSSNTQAQITNYLGPHPADLPSALLKPLMTVEEAYGASIDSLADKLTAAYGGKRRFSKQSWIADHQLEIIAYVTNLHPRDVVERRRALGVLPNGFSEDTARALVSFCVGASVGRWDVRCVMETNARPIESDPFEMNLLRSPSRLEFPVCSNHWNRSEVKNNYALRLNADGILPDDPDHTDDIVRAVAIVCVAIWKDKVEEIEQEAHDLLGVAQLREYFRKSGVGGFWMDHIRRYSKSRRKAPIYWLLQSSRRNYAIWLYYHRLNKDILFKALLNYVEPKVRREEVQLKGMVAQKQAAGTAGRAAKQLERDIERQEGFVSEMHDFRDKLKRAADLNLVPDLNDGVVLNIAPLHELVPWREAKEYWDELLAGKYEWSSIAKQLREKGLVTGR